MNLSNLSYRTTSYDEIADELPESSLYKEHYDTHWRNRVIVIDGDWILDEPLDLDAVDELSPYYNPDDYDSLPLFILVKGNMQATNIYNGEICGSCGLVVLGNLTAENIVVGGQEIFVGGDLRVSGFYWGDYNHGSLTVMGHISIYVFLETDYNHDNKRFEERHNADITEYLTDDDYEGLLLGEKLTLHLKSKFSFALDDILKIDYIPWSWKCWINDDIFPALAKGETIFVSPEETQKRRDEISKKQVHLFPNTDISIENLLRFTYPLLFSLVCKLDKNNHPRFEMWDDNDVFYRVLYDPDDSTYSLYIQNGEEYGVLAQVYEGELHTSINTFTDEGVIDMTATSHPAHFAFLEKEFAYFCGRYEELINSRIYYLSKVNEANFKSLLANERLQDFYAQKGKNADGYITLQKDDFILKVSNEETTSARISLGEHSKYNEDGSVAYLYFHYEWNAERNCVLLINEDENGEEYELNFGNIPRYYRAMIYFRKLQLLFPPVEEQNNRVTSFPDGRF